MKKLLILALAVMLACGALIAGASAEEQGLYKYAVKADGTAEITGINNKDLETMEIPAEVDGHKVTSIGHFAFSDCYSVTNAIIPEGVTEIGDNAFANSYRLESVSIPDSLVSIGSGAFRSERLSDIILSPAHPVFAVENKALINKQDMTLVRFLGPEITGTYEIAEGIRAIGPEAFEFARFSSLVIPGSVSNIGSEAMEFCENLKEVVIPEGVVSIGYGAFDRCDRLESVTIPDSVTEIEGALFWICPNLTSIRVSPDHPVYEAVDLTLVNKEKKEIISASGAIRGKYAIPDGILAIGSSAFQGCQDLEELYIPDSVEKIGRYAFDRNTVVRACPGSAAQKYCEADGSIRFTEISPEDYAAEVQELEQKKADGTQPAGRWGLRDDDDDSLVSGLYRYEVKADGTAEITKADEFLADGIIPAELDGYRVTSIGYYSFRNCAKLEKVVIPEGVESVGFEAFCNCSRLESVSIPDSLVYMDRSPFNRCLKLKNIEISPDHPVFAVENGALVNKRDMTLIHLMDREASGTYTVAQGIRRIDDSAFENSALTSVILPDSLTAIGNHAFGDCLSLTEIVIPEGVTAIGIQAFFGCEKLESVTLPDSLTNVGEGIFGANQALATIRISPDHPAYGMMDHLLVDKRNMRIVMALNSTPAKYEIPEGIKEIGHLAFQGSDDLEELIVPEGMTKIWYSAFSGCEKLREITLPASVKEIGDWAFEYSRELVIKAPEGSWAQQYSREHGYRFEANGSVPAAAEEEPVEEAPAPENDEAEPELPEETAAPAEEAKQQGPYKYKVKEDGTAEITGVDENIEDGHVPAELDGYKVTSIGNYVFHNLDKLETLEIPEGVTSVGYSLVYNCESLESVSIPDSLVSCGNTLFYNCPKLDTIRISPEHPVFAVENKALVNKQEMKLVYCLDHGNTGSYEIAQGIKEIGPEAFSLSMLTSIAIPVGVTTIGSLAFSSCSNLKEMVFPDGVKMIGNQALYNCNNLESVTIPDSLSGIGGALFNDCGKLESVNISPDHPVYKMIDGCLLDKRDNTIISVLSTAAGETYRVPEEAREIGFLSFIRCGKMREVIIPEGVTGIGPFAFNSCYLNVIVLPESVKEIGEEAFTGCGDKTVKAPAGSYAQKYCEENGIKFEALK